MGQTCVAMLLLLISTLGYSRNQVPAAVVTVTPDSSQIFRGDSISFSCKDDYSSAEWTLRRNTSTSTREECIDWGQQNHSSCVLNAVILSDSGVYWCDSRERGASDSVNITVIDHPVIRWSPVLPVAAGQNVTLSCQTNRPHDNGTVFYKDGVVVERSPTGHMTLYRVTKSDEGAYKCSIPEQGESPPAWISVTETPQTTTTSLPPSSPHSITFIIAPIAGFVILVVLVLLVRQCVLRKPDECDPEDVSLEPDRMMARDRAAATLVDDVNYGQIMIQPINRRGAPRSIPSSEYAPENEVHYSSLRFYQ